LFSLGPLRNGRIVFVEPLPDRGRRLPH
jgi:hypothetical protein